MLSPTNFFTNASFRVNQLLGWEVRVAALVLFLVVLCSTGLLLLDQQYAHRVPPNTTIAGIAVGGLTQQEALNTLYEQAPLPQLYQVELRVDDITISSSSAEVPVLDPYPTLIADAIGAGRGNNFVTRSLYTLQRAIAPQSYTTSIQYQDEDLALFVSELAALVDIEGKQATAELKTSGVPASLSIFPGEPGRKLDANLTIEKLNQALANNTFVVEAIVASTSSPLSEIGIAAAQARAARLVSKSITVDTGDDSKTLTDKALISWLQFPTGINQEVVAEMVTEWETEFNRPPANAEFSFDPDTLVVHKFVPDRAGLALNRPQALADLEQALTQLETSETSEPALIQLQFAETAPVVSLADTNEMGITERIGVGNSEYHGSIPSRVHNVAITSDRITNTIIKPGEEFSFNKALGEVSARTGYQPAYVIRAGRTELGDGGGVCQVSSTLFRALLDSGLDITRRLQHSYRVGYYELNSDPGFDATVYAGNVDLRFKNDTDNHVLIHVENNREGRKMRIELYGTSDGRRTEVVDYQKWGAVGAPAPEYILDPSLQPGQKVQIDWAVGGLKTKFTHKVYKSDGELLRENTYYSNYRPWSAKYRVGALP